MLGDAAKASGKWDQAKGKLEQWYGKLTDQQMEYGSKGMWHELKGSLVEKIGQMQNEKEFDDHAKAYQQGAQDAREGKDTDNCGCGHTHNNAA